MNVDLTTHVGDLVFPNPIMTASGTAGYGTELHPYVPLGTLGAHVVKSLAAYPWPGNPAPRVTPAGEGMLNAVGLQGPGVQRWLDDDLPRLQATGARVVASIWGRRVADFADAAALLAGAPDSVVAVEVNLSCPNLEGRAGLFAHDPQLSAEVIAATEVCGRPRWAKLSANTDRVVEVARAVVDAGAAALTLINTLLGLVLDARTGRPTLGAGGGGYSGAPIHPVAVRTVFDVRAALPEVPIVGAGGVRGGWDAVELMLAGASAVQVGTVSFAEPRAAARILGEIGEVCAAQAIDSTAQLTSRAHRGGWRTP